MKFKEFKPARRRRPADRQGAGRRHRSRSATSSPPTRPSTTNKFVVLEDTEEPVPGAEHPAAASGPRRTPRRSPTPSTPLSAKLTTENLTDVPRPGAGRQEGHRRGREGVPDRPRPGLTHPARGPTGVPGPAERVPSRCHRRSGPHEPAPDAASRLPPGTAGAPSTQAEGGSRGAQAGTSQVTPSGGTRSAAENCWPFQGTSSPCRVPVFTTPEPANSSASVLRTSRHAPGCGRPTRKSS